MTKKYDLTQKEQELLFAMYNAQIDGSIELCDLRGQLGYNGHDGSTDVVMMLSSLADKYPAIDKTSARMATHINGELLYQTKEGGIAMGSKWILTEAGMNAIRQNHTFC